jgi:PAS domain-containing protein
MSPPRTGMPSSKMASSACPMTPRKGTLERRIQRRMQAVNLASYTDYLDYLEVHPEEFSSLFNTILINVTSFFRDAEAWNLLRSDIVPELLNSNPTGVVRVWSAGCASGEEAYGLATVFADVLVTPVVFGGRPIGATVTFDDSSRYHKLQEEYEEANHQLEAAYEELQSTNEELETTDEELQSTVEELETTNEELQSTNEELETINEELQSMNDELQSINEELRARTMELDDVNRFMDSVLASLRAAVVVIGKEMQVQAWNRRAENLWRLRQNEVVGQHFLSLDIGLPVHELAPIIRSILSGEPVESTDHGVVLGAVNRRGRQVTVRVSYGPLASADGPGGVIMAMDELEAG